jgi:hypothetical protein
MRAMIRTEVRAQVELCLLHFDCKRYDVDAFVLMPNHVSRGYRTADWLRAVDPFTGDQGHKYESL